ncbi:MAG TPA: TIM-barrel domain-containing protein, partial [Phycisphaerae bacterium]|nr:TIM-barrel domain-containing protein [Phycisphaerae bacterium]
MSVGGKEADISGWQSLGPISGWAQTAQGVQFYCSSARVLVAIREGGVVHVRMTPSGEFARDFSWAVTAQAPSLPVHVSEGATSLELSAGGAKIVVQRESCRFSFCDAHGVELCAEEPARGMSWCGEEVRCYMKLQPGDHFFGGGEKGSPFDKLNTVVTNWNTDAAEHDPWTDPLYQTHPFVLCMREGRSYGVFFDNTYRSFMDFGKTSRGAWSFGAAGGELKYYFIPGPTPADVVRRYAGLVGMPALPPRWSLGYQQCRWSYESAKRASRIAKEFRKREIPCDTIYLDIDYMDGFRCFTWDPKRFPRPAKLMEALGKKGFKVVTIIDPGLKSEPGYWVHDSGIQGDHFLRDADGKVHVGHVWPGESVFPDFTKSQTR